MERPAGASRDDLERAVCQVCTFMIQNEYLALYMPARFIGRIDPCFSEVILFLSSQVMDEARHVEVFTKRALANGGGLQYVCLGNGMVASEPAQPGGLSRMRHSSFTCWAKARSWNCSGSSKKCRRTP